jgi:hypothetical protein
LGFCVSAANVMPGNLALALQGPKNERLGTLRRLPHATVKIGEKMLKFTYS